MRATDAAPAELAPAMHQREARRPRQQLEGPVERRIAAAEDHDALAGELGGIPDAIMECAALERLGPFDADASRLERAEPARSPPLRRRTSVPQWRGESAHRRGGELGDLVAEMQLRLEGLDLLQQSIDQLLPRIPGWLECHRIGLSG